MFGSARERGGVLAWTFLVALLGVQFAALYLPTAPGPPLFTGSDKIVHAGLFGAPAMLSVALGLRPRVAVAGLVLHAPVSELIQHAVLPGRSGDPWDLLADLAGILLGVVVAQAVRRRW